MKRLLLVVLCVSMFSLMGTTAQGAVGAPPGKQSALPQFAQPQSALPARVRKAIADPSKAKVRKQRSASARNRIAARSRALLKRLEAQRGSAKPSLSTGRNGKPLARASYHCYFDYCGTAFYGGGWAGDFYHGGYDYVGNPWYTVYFSYYGDYCYYYYNGGYIYLYDYYYRGAYYGTYWNYC